MPLEQKCLGNCRKTIGEWEDENNAIWPVFDGVVVPKAPDGEFFLHLADDGFKDIDEDPDDEKESDRAFLRNGLRSKYVIEGVACSGRLSSSIENTLW